MGDPTGLTLPIALEELFWGDAGIGLSIFGSGLAAAGIAGNGTPEQIIEWVPQCYGTPDKIKLGAFCVSEPDAGSDVSSLRTKAVYDEAKDEWVLNGTKAWITNGGIADVHVVVASVDPELKGRGQASFIVPPGHAGPVAGPEVQEARHPRVAHRRGRARRLPRPGLVPARRQGEARREAGPGPRGARPSRSTETSGKQPAMATFEATRPAVGAMAVGIARAAYEYSLEYAKERKAFGKPIIMNQSIAFMLANMCTQIDAARLLVWRAAWLSRNGKYMNAEGSQSQALRRPHRRVGHRARHPDPRRLRLHPRVPRRALAPRRQDLRHLRRHRADPGARDLPGDLRPAHRVADLHFSFERPARRAGLFALGGSFRCHPEERSISVCPVSVPAARFTTRNFGAVAR